MKTIALIMLVNILLVAPMSTTNAQEILLDQMVSAEGLKLFPVYGDPKSYYYLPDKIEIAKGADGKEQFSFLKFVNDDEGNGEGGIQNVDGGGLVTFLVEFAMPDSTIQRAQSKLQQQVSGARIVGPVNYRSGTFALVSEFQQENGDWTKRALGMGKAAIMEEQSMAISIRLTKTGATILWESFKQSASNINVSFEMIIAGYRNPYEAKMTAWWEKIASNRAINIGARTDFLGVDIQDIMKELKESGAIELEVKGEDEKMDRLWEIAYGKLAAQMFEPANDPITLATLQDDPNVFSNFDRADKFNKDVRDRIREENNEQLSQEEREIKTLMRLSETWPFFGDIAREDYGVDADQVKEENDNKGVRQPTGAVPKIRKRDLQTPPSFSLLASYRKKQFKKTGKFELSFKKWTSDTQAMRFDENIGGFAKRMFDDPKHFRIINLDDPAYKMREVLVQLDGQNSVDFEKFVNFVTVAIRKTHQNGFQHFDELKIDRSNFNQSSNNFTMRYGYHDDINRLAWRNYEYRVTWNLFGGNEWTSGWKSTDDFIIPVVPPHRYREIQVEADPDIFTQENIRLATIDLTSTIFGKRNTQRVSLKPSGSGGGLLSKSIRYAYEPEKSDYEYQITWQKRGNISIIKEAMSGDSDYIFADDLPEEE